MPSAAISEVFAQFGEMMDTGETAISEGFAQFGEAAATGGVAAILSSLQPCAEPPKNNVGNFKSVLRYF